MDSGKSTSFPITLSSMVIVPSVGFINPQIHLNRTLFPDPLLPLVQTAGTALLYKLAAAMIQPVSDERVTGCVEAVGEGCQILMQIVFTVGVLFLLTIAIVAAVTNA